VFYLFVSLHQERLSSCDARATGRHGQQIFLAWRASRRHAAMEAAAGPVGWVGLCRRAALEVELVTDRDGSGGARLRERRLMRKYIMSFWAGARYCPTIESLSPAQRG
jgi:hypothetical protein